MTHRTRRPWGQCTLDAFDGSSLTYRLPVYIFPYSSLLNTVCGSCRSQFNIYFLECHRGRRHSYVSTLSAAHSAASPRVAQRKPDICDQFELAGKSETCARYIRLIAHPSRHAVAALWLLSIFQQHPLFCLNLRGVGLAVEWCLGGVCTPLFLCDFPQISDVSLFFVFSSPRLTACLPQHRCISRSCANTSEGRYRT